MRHSMEIEPSECIVLGCGCGERIVLLGREEDWHGEERFTFVCGECGREVKFVERVVEESDADEEDGIGALVRKLKRPATDAERQPTS